MSTTIAAVEADRFAADQGRPAENAPAMPKHVVQNLVSGTSALGIGAIVERGLSFLANLLAARLSNASTFGAYALAISTANNISSYAAGGIGSTAIRFSGKYPRQSAGYSTLSKALLIISLVSASLAALALCAGAGPIAALLGKQSLAGLLRWSGLSAAGMILLECARGFFVGQRRISAIVLLSLIVGIGMLSLLPLASRLGPVQMICTQGVITLSAVALCLFLYRPLGLAPLPATLPAEPLGPMVRSVWSFGFVQLAGLVGMNAAGWWLTSLVARADTTMVQMGFFAVAHQLRNVVALGPSLLTESSLAVMAQGEGDVKKTPDQVMAVCTLANTFVALALAGIGIILAPWGLTFLYGKTYAAAAAATAVALATAIIHMGNAPAAARLSIVSIRFTGVINTVWAVFVAAGATLFFFWQGSASKAAMIYFAAHLLSAVLILSILKKRACLPTGMAQVFGLAAGASLALTVLSLVRLERADLSAALTAAMLLLYALALWMLLLIGRRERWVPSFASLKNVVKGRIF